MPSKLFLGAIVLSACSVGPPTPPSTPATIGKLVFEDPDLSEPAGQACSDCHAKASAFRDPETEHTTSMGVVPGRFAARNSPSAMYAMHVPPLHYDPAEAQLAGGLFWDGRADSLEDQAAGPLLNPLEMNNPSKAAVVDKLRHADYALAFRAVFGDDALDDEDRAFAKLTAALGAFERTDELAPFSSKYDRYLAGHVKLAANEQRGLAIFEDPARGNCASCHPSRPSADGTPPMFTNFTYANLGVPAYPNNLFYAQSPALNPDGARFIDHGLMRTTGDARDDGKFRVPTLRNIAHTAPYGHNGYFANLSYFIDFLNTREVGSNTVATCSRASGSHVMCPWPAPEVAVDVEHRVGQLGLSPQDIEDLVAFLGTLTDE